MAFMELPQGFGTALKEPSPPHVLDLCSCFLGWAPKRTTGIQQEYVYLAGLIDAGDEKWNDQPN